MNRHAPYIFVVGLFMLFTCNYMFTTGMFLDGLVYSGIAKSMSLGIGSFWHPSFTLTQLPQFYGHPLMMWMCSLLMRLLGGNVLVAKLYSIIIVVVCAVLVVAIWGRLRGDWRDTAWMPLLMCTLIFHLSNHANTNVLEATMAMFALGATWCMLGQRHPVANHVAAGLLLAAAFLTKGFTGLFPLALPFLIWLFGAGYVGQFRLMVWRTATVLLSAVVPLLVVVAVWPDAREFLAMYLDAQVGYGISTVSNVDSRFYIVGRFFLHTAVPWLVCIAVLLIGQHSGQEQWKIRRVLDGNRMGLALVVLTLCGVFPLMISTKQSNFYLVTTYPFCAIALASIVAPYAKEHTRWATSKAAAAVAFVVMAAAVVANAAMFGKPGRDHVIQHDMALIIPHLAEGETVTMPAPLVQEYNRIGGYYYLARQVSIDKFQAHKHLISTADIGLSHLSVNVSLLRDAYSEVPLATQTYKLYELRQE